MLILLAVAAALTQASPAAGNVYLKCVTTQGETRKDWDITLNEAAGTVDYYTPISGQQRRPARFTADAVHFIGFTLSRENLTIQRDVDGAIEAGTCKVADVAKRAF